MAALSHHDVLKTTEPLTCSDGVQNFTCLLSKTDITPVLRELKKIDVAPEASPVACRWVLVLDFNFTEGSWRWRNVTVVRGWELKWNNETAYVFQTQIKKSLGEMIKRTSGQAEIYQPYWISWNLIANSIQATCNYFWIFDNLVTSCDIVAMRSTVLREPRVFRPTESSTPQYGQVVRRLCPYDVWLFSELAKAGITTDVTRGTVISHCFSGIAIGQSWGNLTFNVVLLCNSFVAGMRADEGDSGGPVYRFEGSNDKLGAFGIVSGVNSLGTIVSPICYLPVSVDPTR
jgi:hypothetical protein